ncbi:MAG: 30S ribosomal protein S17 [candidate division Zixibacteria bacterium]|nr:30S ribosomal protein S17 [candidate division Zixibacteria bacterium]
MAETKNRNQRKVRLGTVTSNKMDKTVVVRVDRTMRHPIYQKIFRTSSKLYAHDEKNDANIGDVVSVMETRPLSATKRWRLVEVVKRAK